MASSLSWTINLHELFLDVQINSAIIPVCTSIKLLTFNIKYSSTLKYNKPLKRLIFIWLILSLLSLFLELFKVVIPDIFNDDMHVATLFNGAFPDIFNVDKNVAVPEPIILPVIFNEDNRVDEPETNILVKFVLCVV